MRWIALITAINAIAIAVFSAVMNHINGVTFSWSGVIFVTIITVIFGVAGGLTLGLVGVLLARRLAPDSAWGLIVFGVALGAFGGWLVDAPGQKFWLVGALLGALSAVQWWYFVERHPSRRAYFD